MRRSFIPVVGLVASFSLATACSGSQTQAPSSSGASSPVASSSSSSTSSSAVSSVANRDVVADAPTKSWQQALDAARKDFTGDVAKIELEAHEGDGLEYKIELMSSDTKYAVQYDAETLAKLSDKRDNLGDDAVKERKETFDPGLIIGLDKAAMTARQQQDGIITEWKIEGKDSGRVLYEFDIRTDGDRQDTEVQVDANDGSIVRDS